MHVVSTQGPKRALGVEKYFFTQNLTRKISSYMTVVVNNHIGKINWIGVGRWPPNKKIIINDMTSILDPFVLKYTKRKGNIKYNYEKWKLFNNVKHRAEDPFPTKIKRFWHLNKVKIYWFFFLKIYIQLFGFSSKFLHKKIEAFKTNCLQHFLRR
jgi:hypothetical protein